MTIEENKEKDPLWGDNDKMTIVWKKLLEIFIDCDDANDGEEKNICRRSIWKCPIKVDTQLVVGDISGEIINIDRFKIVIANFLLL